MTVLRVGFVDYFPMLSRVCPKPTFRISSRCLYPGLAVEIMQLIATQANMTIEAIHYKGEFSSSSGIAFDALANGEIDTIGLTFENTEARASLYKFSDPLYLSITQLAVRHTDNTMKRIFDFFSAYGAYTWLAIFLTFGLFTAFGLFIRLMECKLKIRKEANLGDFIWSVVRLQLIQYYKIEFKLMSGSFGLIIFSFLQCAIILSLYQSYIISNAVRYKNPKPFKSDELLGQLIHKNYKLIAISEYDWLYEKIKLGNHNSYYDYRKTLAENPIIIVNTEMEALEKANAGGHVLVFQDDDKISYMTRYFCEMVFIDSPFPQEDQHLIFNKHFKHMPQINKAIQEQKILIQRAHRKYGDFRKDQECKPLGREQALSLHPFIGVIVLFSIGLLLSSLIFFAELKKYF